MVNLLTEKQVEAIYGLKAVTLRNQRGTGQGLPFLKFGGRVLYRVEDIEAYINNNMFHSTTQYQQKRKQNI